MMGLAIAHEARKQVTFYTEPILSEKKFGFSIEKPIEADYGEEIPII